MSLPFFIGTAIIALLALSVLTASAGEQSAAQLWAHAALLGKTASQDSFGVAADIPFSFTYDGKHSSEFLSGWKRSVTTHRASGGAQRYTITFADPKTGLGISCDAKIFDDFPAVEWILHLTNTGSADTPIIENIQPLDLNVSVPNPGNVTFYHSNGSQRNDKDFVPIDEIVPPNKEIKLAPNGGRSSDGNLPFFNLQWPGGGLVGAIGWSGQWEMRLHRDAGQNLTLQSGQQITHLKLHPGESIRTPRILLVMWQGDDRMRGHNLLRQLLLAHYVPRQNGQPVLPPLTQNTWFTFHEGNAVTEQNQIALMDTMQKTGVECYWLDAGWFEGGWPGGAGSWVPKKEAFPNGLRPVGDEAHKRGMKFVLWFEPERVTKISRIASEHPEWVMNASGGEWGLHSNSGDGLYNLGSAEARQWLTDFLSKCFEDWGVDVFRNDFNIDPLRFWRAADAPDRQGMSEIRYIEGLYQMWDDLLRRRPGLAIDDCASGGRRIDLEMISRSFPLWRSDTQCCGRAIPAWDQTQTAGLSLYVPLHSAGVWGFDPYTFRSVATTGTNICLDTRAKDFSLKQARAVTEEMKSLRPLYLGDFYPLTAINTDESQWIGWQFNRPDMGEGFAMFFRRAKSPYAAMQVNLCGVDPKASYEVTFVDRKKKRRLTGAELAKLQVELKSAASSMLVKYRKMN